MSKVKVESVLTHLRHKLSVTVAKRMLVILFSVCFFAFLYELADDVLVCDSAGVCKGRSPFFLLVLAMGMVRAFSFDLDL